MDEAKQAESNNPQLVCNSKDRIIMKTFSFIAAAALLSTGVLLADVAAADTTTKTRAQVVAELVQARSSGELARLNSEDSRVFGPIDDDTIVGRAFMIMWPPGRIGAL